MFVRYTRFTKEIIKKINKSKINSKRKERKLNLYILY